MLVKQTRLPLLTGLTQLVLAGQATAVCVAVTRSTWPLWLGADAILTVEGYALSVLRALSPVWKRPTDGVSIAGTFDAIATLAVLVLVAFHECATLVADVIRAGRAGTVVVLLAWVIRVSDQGADASHTVQRVTVRILETRITLLTGLASVVLAVF